MRILLSCVNSVVSFIGFDLEAGTSFWYCPADRVRACGAAYDPEQGALLVASDSFLTRFEAGQGKTAFRLPGPHENLAHSVHVLPGLGIGIADTGNSRVLICDRDMKAVIPYSPVEGWKDIPPDALHLNDFVLTSRGMVVSCFNYQSFRYLETPGYRWQNRGYGLLLSLEKRNGRTLGRVLAPGLECPHSLIWRQDSLYCCASATGEFVRFAYNSRDLLVEEERIFITDAHFLRGALPLEDGSWILGGSDRRREDSEGMAVYRLWPDRTISKLRVAGAGEIYDILPWEPGIMDAIADLMNGLPPDHADGESVYPPPCTLEKTAS